jgi:hypothetical protein
MPETPVNIGKLHVVACEWCGLKMSCNCWDGNNPDREGHVVVLCPRCQVTDFLNVIFGGRMRREIFSKIEQPKSAANQHGSGNRPTLRILSGKRAPEPRSSAPEASDWKPFQGE